MTRNRMATGIVALAMGAAALLTPPARGAAPAVRHVVFYGFSILGEPMQKGIFPEFQQYWQKKTGERVEFTGSFSVKLNTTSTPKSLTGPELGTPAFSFQSWYEADTGARPMRRSIAFRAPTGPTI